MTKKIFEISELHQTIKLAEYLTTKIKIGTALTLIGDLGVGKTTLSSYIIQTILGEDVEVTSPTFNLVHHYPTKTHTIWHFDLYRLKHRDEVYELGIEEALNSGISIIEWPEIITDLLPKKNKITVQITLLHDNNRIAEVTIDE